MNQNETNSIDPNSMAGILQQRGSQYGDFEAMAMLSQTLKSLVYGHAEKIGNQAINPVHSEAMDMILLKIARIINGNPNNIDSWMDIAGYAKIVADKIAAAHARAAMMTEQLARQAEGANQKRVSATDADKRAAALNVDEDTAAQMAAHAASVVAADAQGTRDTPATAPVAPPSGSGDASATSAGTNGPEPVPVAVEQIPDAPANVEVAAAAEPFPGSGNEEGIQLATQ
ncbi:phosphofructokinase [Burkholderia phage Bm1]